ncbi:MULTISPECIES: EpsG family protein [Enterococcus]|uniref:EpsG family protein n=1 Tax=Enterococcus TaxID=1350 RepID=UPI0023A91F5F|nr:EpsG family protein [Enterococcus faecium]MDE5173773.1 EpsG family protein [Enterococcus faecium]
MYTFVTLLLIIVILIGFIPIDKVSKITSVTLLVFLWIMMAANVDNPDYYNYLRGYNYLNEMKGSEWGYYLLTKFCSSMGLGYNQFKFVLSGIGLFLIHGTVRKYLKSYSLFYIMYFLCPFMIDVTQLRNFIAMAFFIYAVPYLTEETIQGKVKYILLIILGASFQVTAFIYLPIVFLGNVNKNKMIKFILSVVAVVSVIIGLNRGFVLKLITLFSSAFGSYDDRILEFSNVSTRYGFLIYWGLQMITFFLIRWAKQAYEQNAKVALSNGVKEQKEHKLINLVETINTYAFLFLPFYVVQLTYGRFMRNLLPLNFIVLIVAYKKNIIERGKITLQGILILLALIVYVVINFYFMIFMEYKDTIVGPLFSGNWFFNMNWSEWFN